jgi:2-iminobutanoate/2-iminopropanoate deaminase
VSKTEIKHPGKLASTGAYSAGVLIDGWLYISGQGPLDPDTGEIVRRTIEDETQLTLEHVGTILSEADFGFNDVVKCACHLADIGDFDSFNFNKVYSDFFHGVLPARTTVQSVLGSGIKVEIDAIARRS